VIVLAKNKRRKMKKSNGEWQLAGKTNHHHNLAKSRGGTWSQMNILVWDVNVHRAFHLIFGNRTLEEAAEFLRHMNELKLLGIEPDPNWG
jgi:hypothetical protein